MPWSDIDLVIYNEESPGTYPERDRVLGALHQAMSVSHCP